MIDAKEFVLEYNTEEDDPLVMLDKHRQELSERFKTIEELNAYLEQFSSVEEARAILHARIVKQQVQKLESVAQ